jgi:hypothetical protein
MRGPDRVQVGSDLWPPAPGGAERRWVVLQRGGVYETAEVEELRPSHLKVRGGWPKGGFASTALLVLGELEIQTEVTELDGGSVILRPPVPGKWPVPVQRALARVARSGTASSVP